MSSSSKQWACLLRARFLKQKAPIAYYVKSSFWLALRCYLQTVYACTSWQLGDGSNISFLKDVWLSQPIVYLVSVPTYLHNSLHAKV